NGEFDGLGSPSYHSINKPSRVGFTIAYPTENAPFAEQKAYARIFIDRTIVMPKAADSMLYLGHS
ncbi:MAG: hypothetical protein ACOVLE_11000, partial [Pirellula staleyi]